MYFQTPVPVAGQQPAVRVLHHPDHHRQLRGHVHGHPPPQRGQDHAGASAGKVSCHQMLDWIYSI